MCEVIVTVGSNNQLLFINLLEEGVMASLYVRRSKIKDLFM